MGPHPVAEVELLLELLVAGSGLSVAFTVSYHPGSLPLLTAEFTGADVPHLLARNAELLLAMEHLAAKSLRLEPEEHDQISFDAGGFKLARERSLQQGAREAVRRVRESGRPYRFPPMNSRERRLLHLALRSSGLRAQSEGDGAQRHIVLHPEADVLS